MANTYLTKTFGSTGNQRIFTLSFWAKINNGSDDSYIISYASGSGSTPRGSMEFRSDANGNTFRVGFNPTGSSWTNCDVDNRKFRDYSAWYHVVVGVDTTQATSSNRVKIYINGEQQTVSTQPSQNFDTGFNHTYQTSFGRYENSDGSYFQGLLTHINFIDGTQYAASDFGETDSTSGIWKPKTSPSVTYGSNGYFLKFENSGAMGTDSSGNGNNFTVSGNITQNVDTPSNVFATMNPLAMGTAGSLTFSNGNLTTTNGSSTHRSMVSSFAVSSGKWYWEGKSVTTGAPYPTFGIFNADAAFDAGTYFTSTANGYGYNSEGNIFHNNTNHVTGLASWTDGDIIGVALDATNNKIYFSKNGSWQNSGDPSNNTGGTSITADKTWYFAAHTKDSGTDPVQSYNFGSGFFGTTAVASANADANGHGAMEYAVPTGFYTLCTKNIKEFG